jgi:hypothetical protein
MWLHSTNTPAYARRHPRSRFVDSEVDVPATFLGARERHVTRAELAPPAPKGHTCLVPARGRGLSRGRWRARDATHVRVRARGRRRRPTASRISSVGWGPSRRRGITSAPSAPGRTRQTRVVVARSHRLLPLAATRGPARRPRSETAAGGDRARPLRALARFFFWKLKLSFWTSPHDRKRSLKRWRLENLTAAHQHEYHIHHTGDSDRY